MNYCSLWLCAVSLTRKVCLHCSQTSFSVYVYFWFPPCGTHIHINTDTLVSRPWMVVKPNRQTQIAGITNISRYLSRRFCPELYESLDPKATSSVDRWMDLVTLSYLHGNSKEKASVLRQMNSDLGSSNFLTGPHPNLADVVAYGVLGNQASLKLGGNVKEWMTRCHSRQEFNTIPCLYLKQTWLEDDQGMNISK